MISGESQSRNDDTSWRILNYRRIRGLFSVRLLSKLYNTHSSCLKDEWNPATAGQRRNWLMEREIGRIRMLMRHSQEQDETELGDHGGHAVPRQQGLCAYKAAVACIGDVCRVTDWLSLVRQKPRRVCLPDNRRAKTR